MANEKVWKAINGYINSTGAKFRTISCYSCDYAQMRDEMIRELEQNCNSLNNLKSEPLVDERMKTVIERFVGMFTDFKPVYREFFDSMIPIKRLPDSSQVEIAAPVQEKFLTKMHFIQLRDTQEVRANLEMMGKEYNTSFDFIPLVDEMDTAVLTQYTWKIECSILMKLNPDKSASWTQYGKKTMGTWNRTGDIVKIRLDDARVIYYKIYMINRKSMFLGIPGTELKLSACPQ
jgi:hypothetical protein